MSARLPVDFTPLNSFGVELDCNELISASGVETAKGWTFVHASPPTITSPDTFGGRFLFTHTAIANQVMQIYSNNEIFQMVQGRPIWFHGRVLLGPGTPEEENVFLGCMDAFTTAPLVDAGAGPKATGDHFGFYTPEQGGTVFLAADDDMWIAVSQHNGTAIRTVLNAANSIDRRDHRAYATGPGAGIETDFECHFVPTGPVPVPAGTAVVIFDAEVQFWIDGVLVAVHNHSGGTNQITVAATTLMNFGIAFLNTAAATTAFLSRMGCHQLYDVRE